MDKIAAWLKAYIDAHPFDPGDSDCETVLDQLYQAYAESHESDPPEICDGFKELEEFLCSLPLDNNNAVYGICDHTNRQGYVPFRQRLFAGGLLY